MVVKIKDVAKEANVSVATVSRVLNNIPLVNDETKKRVQEAIAKTGYKPNAIARSLKMQKTNTLGIMIPDITQSYYTQVVRGVEDVCNIYNYNIILCNTDSNLEKELNYLNVFLEKQCDGILFIGKSLNEELIEAIKNSKVPIVLGGLSDSENRVLSVTINNEEAGYEITKLLIDNGHKKIAFLNDEDESAFVGVERLKGYERALKTSGIPFRDEYIYKGKYSIKGGYDLTGELMQLEERPTAIVALNDEMAIGAIRKIEEIGLGVPKDISVVGFNNFPVSEWVNPSITTIDHPMYDIGAICARMLIKDLTGKGNENKSMYVPYHMIMRNSVAKI